MARQESTECEQASDSHGEMLACPSQDGSPQQIETIPLSAEDQAALNQIFGLLRSHWRIDFSHYRETTVLRRMTRRIALNKLDSFDRYLDLVTQDPGELQRLYDDLLLSFTEFFRDAAVFEALKQQVFPRLAAVHTARSPIRVWIPGCSTGEEVYSLAIALYEYLEQVGSKVPFQLFGTDLIERHIQQARAGFYSEDIQKRVSSERLERFFDHGKDGFKVIRHIREMCVFAVQDVTQDPPFPRMDLVSCRNVLIYFDAAFQDAAIPLFHFALNSDGYLLLGSSETMGRFTDLFAPIDSKSNIYMKRPSRMKPVYRFRVSSNAARPRMTVEPPATLSQLRSNDTDMYQKVQALLADAYAPPGILVDAGLQIRQFYGHTSPYLEPLAGDASLKLSRMVREGLMPDLFVAIENARRLGARVEKTGVTFKRDEDRQTVDLVVIPIIDPQTNERNFLILFQAQTSAPTSDPAAMRLSESKQLRVLHDELHQTKAQLQHIIEEKDEVNQELWAANEEIQSTNEELQSVNEELEAAKEELESSNEELLTLNETLKRKNVELMLAEEQSRQLLEVLGASQEVAKIGTWWLDVPEMQLHWTAEIYRIFAYCPDIGEPTLALILERVHPHDRADVELQLRRHWREPASAAPFEFRIVLPSQEVRTIEHKSRLLYDEAGTLVRHIGTIQDITQNRAMAEQLRQAEKLHAIGQLAGGIAHDFNNQLTGILGYAEILKDESGSVRLTQYAENVITGVKRASDLTAQLLAFSRKGKFVTTTVDLHAVVADVVTFLTHSIDKKIAIQQRLRASCSTLLGDPTQLQNALLNVAINARDAMPSGGSLTICTDNVTLDAAFCKAQADEINPGTYVSLSVVDTGVGMTPETQAHVFEPFFTTKPEGNSTGMGLAAVYGIVKSHGGAITFTSAPGAGTTFQLYFPTAPPRVAVQTSQEAPRLEPIKPVRILLVEDEIMVRDTACRLLQKIGFQVHACANGADAVEYYRIHWQVIDLVILDVIMPKMDGEETFVALQQVNPELRVLVSSGYSIDGKAQRIIDKGAQGFVQKPYRLSELANKVRQILAIRGALN